MFLSRETSDFVTAHLCNINKVCRKWMSRKCYKNKKKKKRRQMELKKGEKKKTMSKLHCVSTGLLWRSYCATLGRRTSHSARRTEISVTNTAALLKCPSARHSITQGSVVTGRASFQREFAAYTQEHTANEVQTSLAKIFYQHRHPESPKS